jgi:hypothetical protein
VTVRQNLYFFILNLTDDSLFKIIVVIIHLVVYAYTHICLLISEMHGSNDTRDKN